MYSSILSLIRTKEEIELLTEEVRLLKESLFNVGKDGFDTVLATGVRVSVAQLLSEALARSGIEREAFLEGLEKQLDGFSLITLTVAFEPRGKTVDVVSAWVKKNLGETVAIDFQYEPSLFGGVQIVYNGKFIDNSLAKQINAVFAEVAKSI